MRYLYSIVVSMLFFNFQASSMEKENHQSLDSEWTWDGAPRLMDVWHAYQQSLYVYR
jgi:hypothetical protein